MGDGTVVIVVSDVEVPELIGPRSAGVAAWLSYVYVSPRRSTTRIGASGERSCDGSRRRPTRLPTRQRRVQRRRNAEHAAPRRVGARAGRTPTSRSQRFLAPARGVRSRTRVRAARHRSVVAGRARCSAAGTPGRIRTSCSTRLRSSAEWHLVVARRDSQTICAIGLMCSGATRATWTSAHAPSSSARSISSSSVFTRDSCATSGNLRDCDSNVGSGRADRALSRPGSRFAGSRVRPSVASRTRRRHKSCRSVRGQVRACAGRRRVMSR